MNAIERVWRDEAARLVGALVRITRDLSLAEEMAQDALIAALETWALTGVPEKPGAWLMTTARNRALNAIKRAKLIERKHALLVEDGVYEPMPDDALRLIFIACHPVVAREARVALTLRMVAGLTTSEIARAFLSSEVAIGQRITRAKKAIADAEIPFELPTEDLDARLASVLEVVYLVFNEGYSHLRESLVDEAIRLGGLLSSLWDDPEVRGLHALMLLQASRIPARIDDNGDPILLEQQDRAKWDRARLEAGLAIAVGDGPYSLQAKIAASHARGSDWTEIAALYAQLMAITPSPVIELNRALAVAKADGPAAGLAILDALAHDKALVSYHLLPAARGDLLAQLGRFAEARDALERAAALTADVRQRERLLARAARFPSR